MTCSCFLVRYFETLFWDDLTIFWDKQSKQTSYSSKTSFFSQLKIIVKFSSQNIVISSQNYIPKHRTKGHEQAR
jgi:hypothetical protein